MKETPQMTHFLVIINTDLEVQNLPALQEAIADAIHTHAQEHGITGADDPATATEIIVSHKKIDVDSRREI